jgi:hypothetical protein
MLRGELVAMLEGGKAHMSFDEVVEDFPMDRINTKAPGIPYAPWHFLEHLRIAQWDILEFVRNPDHVSPPWPQGYRPAPEEQADERMWFSSIERFRNDLADLVAMARDSRIDLFAPIPHAKAYTIYRELLLVADHNAYHIGEFALLRQALDAWPEHLPYLTGKA